MATEKRLNAQYIALHSTYWMLNCIIFGYTAVFLQSRGYSNYKIGIVFALGNILGFVFQTVISGFIDRTRKKFLLKSIIFIGALTLLLVLAVFLFTSSSFILTPIYTILIASILLLQPLCISLSFYIDSWGYKINFNFARAIGSLSFALISLIIGTLVERVGAYVIPSLYAVVMAAFIFISLLFSSEEKICRSSVSDENSGSAPEASGFFAFISENKRFFLFLIGTSLLFFSNSVIGSFMIEFVHNLGGYSSDLGSVLAFMTLVEVPMMLLFDRLTRRFRCSALLKLSAIMFTVKFFMLYIADSIAMLYVGAAFQAFSFALFIPASVRYVNETIASRNAVKGQSYVTAMMALGSIFASYVGGFLLDKVGASSTLLTTVLVSAAGTAIMLKGIQKRPS